MKPLEFILAGLATWRLAHLLYAEHGPWNLIARLRATPFARRIGVFECFLCVSVWPALPAAALIAGDWRGLVLSWPALSAIAILVERAAFASTFADIPPFFEDQENDHVLRQD
jgi:hypothetical protein